MATRLLGLGVRIPTEARMFVLRVVVQQGQKVKGRTMMTSKHG